MKPGDLVSWKFQFETGLPCEFGIIIEKYEPQYDSANKCWSVLFGDRGILQCQERDLLLISHKDLE